MRKQTAVIAVALTSVVALVLVAKFVLVDTGGGNSESESLLATHPAILNPEVSGRRVVKRVVLPEGKPALNFELTDMNNTPFRLEAARGKLVLIGFIYTSCPDVCGILTMHFLQIQQAFKDIIDKDLVLILITTDPDRDTPERVAAYTRGFQGKWHFLTGTKSQLQKVWDEYGVFVQDKPAAGIVYHTYMVALIDREGLIRFKYIGLVDPEEVIVRDIRNLLTEGR